MSALALAAAHNAAEKALHAYKREHAADLAKQIQEAYDAAFEREGGRYGDRGLAHTIACGTEYDVRERFHRAACDAADAAFKAVSQ